MRSVPWLRSVVIACVVATLVGCGGGDTGGSEDAGTGDVGLQDAGAQDAGGTSGTASVTLSEPSIQWTLFQSSTGRYASKTFTVRASYTSDLAVVGFPPGVTRPSWISSLRTSQLPDRTVEISVTLLPPENARGPYLTTLRVTTRNADGGNQAHADLPIRMDVDPLPPVYQGNVSFSSVSTDAAPPAPMVLALDFRGSTAVSWSATLENVNHGLTNWVALERATDSSLSVRLTKLQRIGQYQSNIVLTFQRDGVSGTIWIPLTYTVTPGKAEARFVAPMAGYVNEPGTLKIRGVGFSTLTLEDVRIGGVSATSFTRVNDTELRVSYPAIGTGGMKPVELVTASGTWRVEMDYLVKARPTAMAGDFTFPTEFKYLVFDSTRDAIIASTASTLYRLQLDTTGWSIATQRDLAWRRFDLTPDGRYLIIATANSVTLLDAVTLADVESYPIPFIAPWNEQPPAGSLLYMLNDGSALVSVAGQGLVMFDSVNRTFRRTTRSSPSNSLLRITQDHSRIVILPNDPFLSGQFTGYFDATIHDFIPFNTGTSYYANRVAYSGDGERLLVNSDQLLDKDFVPLGTLVSTSGAPYNYSLELSPDGKSGYRVDAGAGRLYKYDLTAMSPYPSAGVKTFSPPFSFYAALPATWVTPEGSMMLLGGGDMGASTPERRLVIVPL